MNTQSKRADPRDLRRRLAEVAGAQAGYFNAADAVAVGYSHQAQKFHVDSGNWTRVGRGIFRLPSWPVGEHDDLVRWALWARGRAVVSHETALRVHDLGDVNPTLIDVTVPSGFRQSAQAVRIHRGVLLPSDVVEHAGYKVTTPTRSLVDVAAADLPPDQLEIAVRDAIQRGVTTRRRLIAHAETFNDRATLRIERALGALAATQ